MTVESSARQASRSPAVHALARLGLASRGLVWLVIGLLALQVLLGDQAQTDQGGALRAVADKPFGEVLLVVLVVGFLGYAAYLLLSAAVGHRDEQGGSRLAHRLESLGKGLVYLGLAGFTLRFLLEGGGEDKTRSTTAQVLQHTGGRTAVALAGAALVALGLYKARQAVKEEHAEKLKQFRMPDRLRRPGVLVGVVGLLGRSAVLVLIGAFLISAAVQADPDEAKGLDAALQTVAEQPYGKVLLAVAVVGLLAYAVWSFVEAAYRDLDRQT